MLLRDPVESQLDRVRAEVTPQQAAAMEHFAFVFGLTIGYDDLVPKEALARMLAASIGLIGIMLTGLAVAIGVHALHGYN